MITIVIIGIIATISVTTFKKYYEDARIAKKKAEISQLVSIFNNYITLEEDGVPPSTNNGHGKCIGLNDLDTCWGGKIVGDTNLNNSIREYLTISGKSVSLDGYGDNYAYHKGTLVMDSCSSIGVPGDGIKEMTGAFIIYQPKDYNSAHNCYEDMGFFSCCGGVVCNDGGYYCAMPIGKYEITGS